MGSPSYVVTNSGTAGGAVSQLDILTFNAVPTAGTYDITYGSSTQTFNYNATSSTLETWIQANVDSGATVTGDPTIGFTIKFSGEAAYSGSVFELLVASAG